MSRLQDGRPAPPGAVRTRGLGRPLPARGRDAREHVLPPRRTLQARPLPSPRGPEPGRVPRGPSEGRGREAGACWAGPGAQAVCRVRTRRAPAPPGTLRGWAATRASGLSPVDTEEPRAGARPTLPSPRGGRSGRRGPPCSAPSGRLSPERRSCVGHQGRRAARTGLARETALPPRVHVDGWPLGHGPAGALGASKRLCVRGPCSRHGPLTSRELEGGPGVPATSGARGTLQRRRRADSEQDTGMRTATQAALAVAVAGAVAGGPGHSGVQRDSSHGRRKEPCEGRSDPGSSDPGQGCVGDATSAGAVLRRVASEAPAASFQGKGRASTLPGSRPPGAPGTLWGGRRLGRRCAGKLARCPWAATPREADTGGQRQGRAKAAAARSRARGQEDLPGPQRRRQTRSGLPAGFAFHQEERPSLDSQVREHPPSTLPAPEVTRGVEEGAGS